MQSTFVQGHGVRLHAITAGDPALPPLLLLHGFPEFWFSWRHLIPQLATRYHILAPDLRGYNLSDKPQGVDQYSIQLLAADVIQLIRDFSPTPVTLCGHDWGGAIAWAVAAAQPALLSRLVILNAPHPSTFIRDILSNPAQQRASNYMLHFRHPDAEAVFTRDNFAKLRRAMGVESSWSPAEIEQYLQAWSQPGAFTAMLNYYRAMAIEPPDPPRPIEGHLPSIPIHVPTTVIWGMRDHALLPSLLDGLEQYVPNLTIHRIPHATHWIQHDAPNDIVHLI